MDFIISLFWGDVNQMNFKPLVSLLAAFILDIKILCGFLDIKNRFLILQKFYIETIDILLKM